jgi:hypothetical protein
LGAIERQAFTSPPEDSVGVSGEFLRDFHHASPGTGGLRVPDYERDFSEAFDSAALKCGDKNASTGVHVSIAPPLTEDPESPRDIVNENVLVLFPLALSFIFLLFGLVIAFSN